MKSTQIADSNKAERNRAVAIEKQRERPMIESTKYRIKQLSTETGND
jgi:hypothetical protein